MINNYIDLPCTSSMLPTGAATSANQLIEIAILNSVEGTLAGISDVLTGGVLKSYYNEVTSVASGVLTTIQTYTVTSTIAYLQKVNISGTNIATYEVLINAVVQEKKRTYFGGNLNEECDFSDYSKSGLPLVTGDVVVVRVLHNRPFPGNFNSRLQVIEV